MIEICCVLVVLGGLAIYLISKHKEITVSCKQETESLFVSDGTDSASFSKWWKMAEDAVLNREVPMEVAINELVEEKAHIDVATAIVQKTRRIALSRINKIKIFCASVIGTCWLLSHIVDDPFYVFIELICIFVLINFWNKGNKLR